MHACVSMYMSVCVHACMHEYVCVCVYLCVCMHACVMPLCVLTLIVFCISILQWLFFHSFYNILFFPKKGEK